MRTLKQGQTGPSVVTLKKLLYNHGLRDFSGANSSNRYNPFFSQYTAAAVRRFQKRNGLPTDGVVGPKTWAKLQGEPDPGAAAEGVSDRGINLIAKYEGFKAHAYKPVPGEQYWTIGYGHYGPDVKPGQTITQSEAKRLLRKDVARFESAVRRCVKVPVNQNRFDALTSLAFNIGEGAFCGSTLVRKLNGRDYRGASRQFLRWAIGANGPLLGLLRRRREERALFDRKP